MKGKKIEYWKSANDGQWYYRVKAGNGKIVGHGGGYRGHDQCLADIVAVREAIRDGLVIEPWQSTIDGQWYFSPTVGGFIRAQSEGYTRKGGCRKGIKAFRNIVYNAPVIRAAR